MSRIFGGIEESSLEELVKRVLQEQLAQTSVVQKLMQGFESLELLVQQDLTMRSMDLAELQRRAESFEAKVVAQRGVDMAELRKRADTLERKVNERAEFFEHFEQRMIDIDHQKVNVQDVEDRLATLPFKPEKAWELSDLRKRVCELSDLCERVGSLERDMRSKASANHVDCELNSLRKSMQVKAGEEVEEKLSAPASARRVWHKTRVESICASEGVDRMDRPTPMDFVEFFKDIDRRVQQKADGEMVDASLEELVQRMELKADYSVVDGRLREMERQLLQKANSIKTSVSAQLVGMQEAVAQKADLADLEFLQLVEGGGQTARRLRRSPMQATMEVRRPRLRGRAVSREPVPVEPPRSQSPGLEWGTPCASRSGSADEPNRFWSVHSGSVSLGPRMWRPKRPSQP